MRLRVYDAFPGVKNHNTSDIRDELGHSYVVGNNIWTYVRATAAVTAGTCVMSETAHVAVTDITGSSNVSDRAKGIYPYVEDSGLSWTVDYYVGSYLYVHSNTGAGQMKRIRSNTATRAYLEALFPEMGEGDAFTTALDTTSDVTIISPYQVQPSTSQSEIVLVTGVAPFAFTQHYYGYIITGGPCLCLSGTDNNALVANKPVCPGDNTAAGYCTGVADGNDLFDAVPFGHALHAAADQQAAPVWVRFLF